LDSNNIKVFLTGKQECSHSSKAVQQCWADFVWKTVTGEEDLNSFSHGELETTRTPSDYVDEDYPARPEIQ